MSKLEGSKLKDEMLHFPICNKDSARTFTTEWVSQLPVELWPVSPLKWSVLLLWKQARLDSSLSFTSAEHWLLLFSVFFFFFLLAKHQENHYWALGKVPVAGQDAIPFSNDQNTIRACLLFLICFFLKSLSEKRKQGWGNEVEWWGIESLPVWRWCVEFGDRIKARGVLCPCSAQHITASPFVGSSVSSPYPLQGGGSWISSPSQLIILLKTNFNRHLFFIEISRLEI